MSEGFSIRKIFAPNVSATEQEFDRVHISADGTMETEGQLAVDVFVDDDKIDILAPLAGLDSDDIRLKIENEVLTISGKREKPRDVSGEGMVEECFWGPFSRSIILPTPAKVDEIKATFAKGVLHVTVPKLETHKSKIIKINQA